jgi:hypothetical protein
MPARIGNPIGLPRIIAVLGIVAAIGLVVAILALGGNVAARLRNVSAIRPSVIIWLVVLVAVAAFLYWFVFRVHRLNLQWLGLSQATSLPAVPFLLSDLPHTILGLLNRGHQLSQAVDGLSTVWTIGETTETAYTFMGMGVSNRASDPRTRLFLDRPEQFAMSWSTLGGLQENATRDWLKAFAASLADPRRRRGSSGRPSRGSAYPTISSSCSGWRRTTCASGRRSGPAGTPGWRRSGRRASSTSST